TQHLGTNPSTIRRSGQTSSRS
ncbi:hypothetical protein CP8484711_1895B, partial [Chlamydia psittaci 84-8471/1]